MISQLFVTNYILIEHLEFNFIHDFMVVTGETGAGKSIFIHALSLLLGQRLNKDIVGPFDDKALIEAVFEFEENSKAFQVLKQNGFECEEQMIFSRQVDQAGRSTYRVNRQVIPLSLAKEILEDEIDIHSQFNTQALLDEHYHLSTLDQLLTNEDLIDAVKDAYLAYKKLIKEKENFESQQLSMIELEMLEKEISKLQDYQLSVSEEAKINESLSELKEQEQQLKQLNEARHVLDEVNFQLLYDLIGKNNQAELEDLISSAYYQLSEADQLVDKILASSSYNHEQVQWLNERAYLYSQLHRRYNRSTEEILDYIQESLLLIENSSDIDRTLAKYDQKIDLAYQQYLKVAQQLSQQRQQVATYLEEALMKSAQDLSLNHFKFKVNWLKNESEHGLEDAHFMVIMNKGQDYQPLAKVASGGELSRLMLALKVLFNQQQPRKLIVFDEIDTGVSGKVAQQMGVKMSQLAKQHALLVVTHLPIVAAFGDQHYLVKKIDQKDSTLVTINQLNDSERIDQIALMLSSQVTEISRQAALDLVKQTKELEI